MTARSCSLGALYTTLDRLEQKGYIETYTGEPTPERGGRAKKMIRITASGTREARAFYESFCKISAGAIWAADGRSR